MAVKISKLRVVPREPSPVAARLRAIAREMELLAGEIEGGTTQTHAPKLEKSAPRPAVELLTAEQVATRLNLPLQRIYELVRQKRLPHVRVGRQIRFSSVALAKWIDDGGAV